MKILSVIIPAYNMERYLPRCLASLAVEPMLMEKLEVIVVNDGSMDRTSSVAHEFAARFPASVHVLDKPNGHYGSCINAGLARVRGTFVRVLDADDFFDGSGFRRFLRLLEKETANPPDFILTEFCRQHGEGAVPTAGPRLPFANGQRLTVADIKAEEMAYGLVSLTYRTGLLRECGYRQTEGIAYTDVEWCTIPMSAARRGAYLDCTVYCYFLGREGQSVGEAARVAGWGAQVKVLERLLATHDGFANASPEGLAFLEDQAARLLEGICKLTALQVPFGETCRKTSDLRQLVAGRAWLWQRVSRLRYASFVLGTTGGLRFRLLALRCYARARGLFR